MNDESTSCNNKQRSRSGMIPAAGVAHPKDIDVLLGRGKKLLNHPGNIAYRDIVLRNKLCYATCLKSDKNNISRSIVSAIYRQQGRFLKQDNKTKMWLDVGEKKALEKTSQALREHQPTIRDVLNKQGETIDFSTTFLPRQAPFRATSTDDVDNKSKDPIGQTRALIRTSTIDNSCVLERQCGFRVANEATNGDELLAESTLVRASTLDISSIQLNCNEDPLLPASPLSSPALVDVSRKIFEQKTASFRDEESIIKKASLIDVSQCEESSGELSLLSRMSGLTEDFAMSERKFLSLQGISTSASSMMSSDSSASNDKKDDGDSSFMRKQPTKYNSLASNDSMPTVKSVRSSNVSTISCMSGFSSTSLDVSDSDVDKLVYDLVNKKMSLDVIPPPSHSLSLSNIQENEYENGSETSSLDSDGDEYFA